MTLQQGTTIVNIFRSQACMVTDCKHSASSNAPFCRSCYAAMPKRSRRRFWKLWQEKQLFQGFTAESGVLFWRLVAARLAKQKRQMVKRLDWLEAQHSKYREVTQLHSMGVNLEYISRLAITCQQFQDKLMEAIKQS